MAEYIDREALIKDLIGLEKELFPDHKELGPFDLGILQGATFAITKTKSISAADVQPVVRCKDCRWWCTDCMPDEFGWCDARMNKATDEDWFCADGKRRTDDA